MTLEQIAFSYGKFYLGCDKSLMNRSQKYTFADRKGE